MHKTDNDTVNKIKPTDQSGRLVSTNRKLHLFLYDSWWHQNLIKDLFPAWSSNCMIDWVKGFVKTFNNSIFASLLFNLDNGATSNSVTNSK